MREHRGASVHRSGKKYIGSKEVVVGASWYFLLRFVGQANLFS